MNLTKREFLFLLLIWLIATILNITKPFHIDDAYHLEAAIHIAEDPLNPSSGFINWGNVPEPLSQSNQPPLFFYLLALTGHLTSFSEIPLHLLISIFTFLSLYFFLLTAKLLKPNDAIFITVLFGFSPAFLVNQNIMVDVPLLSASLAFAYFSLKAGKTGQFRYFMYAGIALGVAVLIKFTIVPLFVVMLVSPFFYRKPVHSFAIFIPLFFITAWSMYNIHEFNDVQLFTRKLNDTFGKDIGDKLLSFLSCIGAISPFALMLFASTQKNSRKLAPYIIVLFTLLNIFLLYSWTRVISTEYSKEIIRYMFMLLGLVVFATIFISGRHIISDLKTRSGETFSRIFLILWFTSLTAFIILFAPFTATRHVLLVIPAYMLIIPATRQSFPKVLKVIALSSSIIAGIMLSISDYHYASFYKEHSEDIAHKYGRDHKIWALGHWGWQWYSRVNGFKIYNTCISDVQEGDIFVYPASVPLQQVCPLIHLENVEERWDEPGIMAFFSTREKGSFYHSDYKNPAWQLSRMPTDTIIVKRVTKIEQSAFREHDHTTINGSDKQGYRHFAPVIFTFN